MRKLLTAILALALIGPSFGATDISTLTDVGTTETCDSGKVYTTNTVKTVQSTLDGNGVVTSTIVTATNDVPVYQRDAATTIKQQSINEKAVHTEYGTDTGATVKVVHTWTIETWTEYDDVCTGDTGADHTYQDYLLEEEVRGDRVDVTIETTLNYAGKVLTRTVAGVNELTTCDEWDDHPIDTTKQIRECTTVELTRYEITTVAP